MRKTLFFLVLVGCTDDSPPRYDLDSQIIFRDASVPISDVFLVDNLRDTSVDTDMALECPLSPSPIRIGTEPCERGNLSPGLRTIWCDKGYLHRGPCEPCVLEVCDGEDNDCDGILDEGIYTCDTACGPGTATCLGGTLVECTAPPVMAEVCDLTDNDCDGQVDEDITRACYTGPAGTEGVGVCSPGLQVCQDGLWGSMVSDEWLEGSCETQVHPSEEICDGADNDCDGVIDYGTGIENTDILFIVDWSSSMGRRIDASLEALNRFSRQFQASRQLRWGLIIGPVRTVSENNPRIYIENLIMVSNITIFETFLQSFEAAPRIHSGGREMLLDAVFLSLRNISANIVHNPENSRWVSGTESQPALADFFVDWRPDARRVIIVFSDETERSFMRPANTIYNINDSLSAAENLKLYSFAPGFYGWDELAVNSGGLNFPLSGDPDEMYENLVSILDEACREEEQGASVLDILRKQPHLVNYIPAMALEKDKCF